MSSAGVAPNNTIFCCPVGSSQYNKMLQPFLLLLLALFVLPCIDTISPKAIFACLGLVTIQDHLRVHQVHNQIEDLLLKSFLSKNRLKQLHRNGARNRVYRQRRSWQNSILCSPIVSSAAIFECLESVSLYWQIKSSKMLEQRSSRAKSTSSG